MISCGECTTRDERGGTANAYSLREYGEILVGSSPTARIFFEYLVDLQKLCYITRTCHDVP